jgi:serine phosphatase RsbU (regulator of sigma subunit)
VYDDREFIAPIQGVPLGIADYPAYVEGSVSAEAPTGVLLFTDGVTEARHGDELFGIKGVRAALNQLEHPSPREALAVIRARLADITYGTLTDDLCMLAARIV